MRKCYSFFSTYFCTIIIPRLKEHPVFLYYLYLLLSLLIFFSLFSSLLLLYSFLFNTEKNTSNTLATYLSVKISKMVRRNAFPISRFARFFFRSFRHVLLVMSVYRWEFFPPERNINFSVRYSACIDFSNLQAVYSYIVICLIDW